MSSKRPDRKPIRREQADQRHEDRSPGEQWRNLDRRLGPDRGAMQERAQLYVRMDDQ
jgi:hypothetical protein